MLCWKLNDLSFVELDLYVEFLVKTDLLKEILDILEITEKGKRFLEDYKAS